MSALDERIAEAHGIVDEAIRVHVTEPGKQLAGVVILFSGGRDSTVLAHLMRERADYLGHCNTGIGVEETRQFVRDTAELWGLPLLERHGESYRDLVLEGGFPGGPMHRKFYVRLKERALDQIRRELVVPKVSRVVFLGGIRRAESARRSARDEHHRNRSIVWCSPIVHWTNDDMAAYREAHPDMPHNDVSDHLHMSGECLCGCYAKPGELDMLGLFYPQTRAAIEALEAEVRAAGHPEPRCYWGWGDDAGGHYRDAGGRYLDAGRRRSGRIGPLCSSCEVSE